MPWLYLFIASLFEIAWTFSLKFLSVGKLKTLHWQSLFQEKELFLLALVPFAGYIVFGLGNIFFFSLAMKEISASVALAVWMGLTLVGVKLVELTVFRQSGSSWQFLYMALILIGIIGLKRNS